MYNQEKPQMTVKDLKAILENFPDDKKIFFTVPVLASEVTLTVIDFCETAERDIELLPFSVDQENER